MNADELFEVVTSGVDVLRVETLDAYDAESDADFVDRFLEGAAKPDPAEKATWLGLISAAAERGHPWRRLRVINRPVTDYVRYACEWGYTDNVAAGEDVRVFDGADDPVGADLRRYVGDFYVVDKRVIEMRYDRPTGRFIEARQVTDRFSRMRRGAERDFAGAQPFTQWWAAHPELHRDLSPV